MEFMTGVKEKETLELGQLLEEDICREEHDIQMDIVVTERQKYLIEEELNV